MTAFLGLNQQYLSTVRERPVSKRGARSKSALNQTPSTSSGHDASYPQSSPAAPVKTENSNYKPSVFRFGGDSVSPEGNFDFNTPATPYLTDSTWQPGSQDLMQPKATSTAQESIFGTRATPSSETRVQLHSTDSSHDTSQRPSSGAVRPGIKETIERLVGTIDAQARMRPFDELADIVDAMYISTMSQRLLVQPDRKYTNLQATQASLVNGSQQRLVQKQTELDATTKKLGEANIAKDGLEMLRDKLRAELTLAKARPKEQQQELDTKTQDVNKYLYEKNAAEMESKNFKALYEKERASHRATQVSLEKEKADRQATLAGLADPTSPRHLTFKLRRLESDNAEIPKLRVDAEKGKKAQRDLVTLQQELQEFKEEVQRLSPLADEAAKLNVANDGLVRENNNLKTKASDSEAVKANAALRQANKLVGTLEQRIKDLKQGNVDTTANGPSALNTHHAANAPDAKDLGLDTFQPVASNSYDQESARLLNHICKLLTTAIARAESISAYQGQGWSAYEQLKNLMTSCATEITHATKSVLALDTSIKMDSEGFPALSGGSRG